ncbi:hypothetical protein AB0L75_14590 [Streptomyces sp. NPDC052101]|uniref:hypothetical protein n=1 Tax=Streptomyces sp. NPDC052101 TaxID=3155763 RepID=UPI00341F5FAC
MDAPTRIAVRLFGQSGHIGCGGHRDEDTVGHLGAGRRVAEHAVDADGILVELVQQKGWRSIQRGPADGRGLGLLRHRKTPTAFRSALDGPVNTSGGQAPPVASTLLPLPCKDSASPMPHSSATAARAVDFPMPYIVTISASDGGDRLACSGTS